MKHPSRYRKGLLLIGFLKIALHVEEMDLVFWSTAGQALDMGPVEILKLKHSRLIRLELAKVQSVKVLQNRGVSKSGRQRGDYAAPNNRLNCFYGFKRQTLTLGIDCDNGDGAFRLPKLFEGKVHNSAKLKI